MSQRLAAEIAPWLTPPPPVGTPPERLLAAVVAERRRRDEQRMATQASATQAWATQLRRTRPQGRHRPPCSPTPQETYGLRPAPVSARPAPRPLHHPQRTTASGGSDGFTVPS